MNINSYSDLWKRLENDIVYSILKDNALFIEKPKEWDVLLKINFFISSKAAEQYKNMLIEKDIYRPSELRIRVESLKDICSLKDRFISLGDKLYSLPVQVNVVDIYEDKVIAEDAIIDMTKEIN